MLSVEQQQQRALSYLLSGESCPGLGGVTNTTTPFQPHHQKSQEVQHPKPISHLILF